MDPFSHYMFAWLIGRKLRLTDGCLKLFLVLALLPDFDMASLIFGLQVASDFHGTLTHSVFVALVLGVLASIVLARVLRVDLFRAVGYGILAVLTHFLLDLFNLTAYLNKGLFLWPVYPNSLFLESLLDIPFHFSLIIYLAILLSLISALFHFWRRNDPPWNVWLK